MKIQMDERELHFRQFLKYLMIACKRIGEDYFRLRVASSKELLLRERVYCYELYHQLRIILENKRFRYTLHGEVDKRGHKIIHRNYIPDFIVHVPGEMKNLVIIEVKPLRKNVKLKYDIDKLKYFIDEAEYYRGIMLVFGNADNQQISRVKDRVEQYIQGYENSIFLIWHKEYNRKPEILLPQNHQKFLDFEKFSIN